MKSNTFFKCFYVITFISVILNMFFMLKDTFMFSIQDLPQGKYMYSVSAPTDENKTADIYYVSNVLGEGVRIQISENGETKNVFWQTNISDVSIYWMNGSVISVNNMMINIAEGGYYDCRLGTSIILEGSLDTGVITE